MFTKLFIRNKTEHRNVYMNILAYQSLVSSRNPEVVHPQPAAIITCVGGCLIDANAL